MSNISSVPSQETGPDAPEQEQSEELIAGEFESQEDLIAAYKELKAKQSEQPGEDKTEEAGGNQEQPEADETGYVPPTEEKTDEDRQYEVETYGQELADVFEKANLNAKHVSQFFHETGKFPETAYKALEEQGISRSAVDNYLSGSAEKAQANAAMAERDVKEVKNSVGGEEEYGRLMQWASRNLTPQEIEEFNSVLQQGKTATKFAVQALHARYAKEMGSPEPKRFGGKAGSTDTVGRYNSKEEMLADMRDPRYKKGDKAFHAMVTQKLANSSIFG